MLPLKAKRKLLVFSPFGLASAVGSRSFLDDQPLGNQELWKFVHSVYGTELGFSSNDEAPSPCIVAGISASAGEASPLSEAVQPVSIQEHHHQSYSSPSPSLHSAQTSNDEDSGVLHPVVINNRHHRHHHHQQHFNNQLNSRRHHQVRLLSLLAIQSSLSLAACLPGTLSRRQNCDVSLCSCVVARLP